MVLPGFDFILNHRAPGQQGDRAQGGGSFDGNKIHRRQTGWATRILTQRRAADGKESANSISIVTLIL
jgi:hypothetical protein